MPQRFISRAEAGQVLARLLAEYRGRADVIVLGLPRGGVPVAYEVAHELRVPLDVLVVRKLGVPGHAELALGAIASGGALTLNPEVVNALHLGETDIQAVIQSETRELERRERLYRGDRPPLRVAGHTVILVDDGLATGASMRVAVQALRALEPDALVVAVPVAPPGTAERLATDGVRVICAAEPEPFYAVGQWYDDFSQTTDAEVGELLARAAGATS